MLLRIATYILLAALIWWGLRSIWRDWRSKFATDDAAAEQRRQEKLARNRKEAKGPGVIELKQDKDGVYRPDKD